MKKFAMHCHTKGRSPCAMISPEDVAKCHKAVGYDGIVVTDHFIGFLFQDYYTQQTTAQKIEHFLDGYREVKYYGEKLGMTVLLGMELNPQEYNHEGVLCPIVELLTYGLTEDFVRTHPDLYALPHSEIYRLAEENNLLLIQSHPFRSYTERADPRYLHGIEVFNAHTGQQSNNDLAAQLAASHPEWILTAGDDCHDTNSCGNAGMLFPDDTDCNEKLVAYLRAGKGIVVTDWQAQK